VLEICIATSISLIYGGFYDGFQVLCFGYSRMSFIRRGFLFFIFGFLKMVCEVAFQIYFPCKSRLSLHIVDLNFCASCCFNQSDSFFYFFTAKGFTYSGWRFLQSGRGSLVRCGKMGSFSLMVLMKSLISFLSFDFAFMFW